MTTAAVGSKLTITTTATAIVTGGGTAGVPKSGVLKNPSGGSNIYLGGDNIDVTNNGFLLEAGESIAFDLVDAPIYAMTSSSTATAYLFINNKS